MARIFISYRRQDSAYPAGILRDALQARFGTDSVFLDLDNIPFGVDFRQYIGTAVGQCDVLLALIGDQWLQLTDDQGRRRIEDLSDFVRIEIESALKRDIPVVPVLVEEAKMPGASELPESIRDLAYRNAAEIGRGRDQKHQIERLISDLERNWPAKVSDAEEEKPAAAVQEEPSALEPREKIARPKTLKSIKRKPKVTESAKAQITPAISKAELDRRAAFLDRVLKVFEGVPRNALWLGGGIPPPKASAATKSYAPDVSQDAIMLLYDDTAFGGAKDGFLLTVDAIYWKNTGSKPGFCRYVDVQGIRMTKNPSGKLWINNERISIWHDPTDQIARGVTNLIRSLKPELQATELAAAKSTVVISKAELDRRAAFLEKLRKAFKGIKDDHLWFSGAIPSKIASAATEAYAPDVSHDAIMLLYDDTSHGSAKTGFLLTVDAIYWSNREFRCLYADIKQCWVTKGFPRTAMLCINTEQMLLGDWSKYKKTRAIAQAVVNFILDWKTHPA